MPSQSTCKNFGLLKREGKSMVTLIRQEFIFEEPVPFQSCHASSVLKTGTDRFVAAWFAGTAEGKPDVMIWSSIRRNGSWSRPVCLTKEAGIPHWNPVLFRLDKKRIWLFYKVGSPIAAWKTMMLESTDEGESWTELGEMIPGDCSGGRGPVKDKAIRTANGRILAPGSTENLPWRPFVDVSDDHGRTWVKHPIPFEGPQAAEVNLIQPSLWESEPGKIHALLRSNQGKIYRADSSDNGESWCGAYATELPNNNSGLDCVLTDSGRLILVCNPVGENWGKRTPLSVLVSDRSGKHFTQVSDLVSSVCEGEYSYPAVIADGNSVYITYTWNRRRIRFAELLVQEEI